MKAKIYTNSFGETILRKTRAGWVLVSDGRAHGYDGSPLWAGAVRDQHVLVTRAELAELGVVYDAAPFTPWNDVMSIYTYLWGMVYPGETGRVLRKGYVVQ